jgi:hypothetical protein
MINQFKSKLTKLFEKHFRFLEDYGYLLKKSRDSNFYSQSLFFHEDQEIVISVTYDLRENRLSVSIWKAINSNFYEMKNDSQSTSLELLMGQEKWESLFKLPALDTLNDSMFNSYIEKLAQELKRFIRDLSINMTQ